MRSGRNWSEPVVPVSIQRIRILAGLAAHREACGADLRCDGLHLSALGECAFPDRRFGSRQGAALAVARTARGLYDDGLICGRGHGYAITTQGMAFLAPHGASISAAPIHS